MTPARGLDRLVSPRSVAIVGASPRRGHFANQPLVNLRRHGYAGAVYPVNPSHQEVEGYRCYPALTDLPEVPDLVVVVVRPELAVEAVQTAGELGVGAAVVVGSGFAETDSAEGIQRQEALLATVTRTGLRLCGPNTLGVANFCTGAVSYASGNIPDQPRAGSVAIVSQSGGCSFTLLNRAWRSGIGVGHVAVAGNEIDVTIPDLVGYYLEQPEVNAVACYLEAIRDVGGLRLVAERARQLGKPVFVMKSGASAPGQRAAAAHTGALATSDAVCDSAFGSWGLPRARSFDELIGATALAARFGPGYGQRFGVYAQGGGVAVVASDLFDQAGLDLAEIGPETVRHIKQLMPDTTPGNPFDSGGQFLSSGPAVLTEALNLFTQDPDVATTVYMLMPVAGLRSAAYTAGIVASVRQLSKPCVALQYGAGAITEAATDQLIDAGVLVLDPPEAGVAALKLWTATRPASPPNSPEPRRSDDQAAGKALSLLAAWRTAGRSVIPEYAAQELLSLYGIAQVRQALVTDLEDLAAAAARLCPPYALKIASDDIPHRSDVGGVVLGLADGLQAAAAYRAMMTSVRETRPDAAIDGATLSETGPAGVELIVGFRTDPTFGPVLLLGTGGIDAEVWQDSCLRLPPVGRLDIEAMIDALRCRPLLRGTRGRAAADLDALSDLVIRVAELAADLSSEIETLEMNPVLVGPASHGAVAVDALVELRR